MATVAAAGLQPQQQLAGFPGQQLLYDPSQAGGLSAAAPQGGTPAPGAPGAMPYVMQQPKQGFTMVQLAQNLPQIGMPAQMTPGLQGGAGIMTAPQTAAGATQPMVPGGIMQPGLTQMPGMQQQLVLMPTGQVVGAAPQQQTMLPAQAPQQGQSPIVMQQPQLPAQQFSPQLFTGVPQFGQLPQFGQTPLAPQFGQAPQAPQMTVQTTAQQQPAPLLPQQSPQAPQPQPQPTPQPQPPSQQPAQTQGASYQVTCPSCGGVCMVQGETAGGQFECPYCRTRLQLQLPGQQSAPPAGQPVQQPQQLPISQPAQSGTREAQRFQQAALQGQQQQLFSQFPQAQGQAPQPSSQPVVPPAGTQVTSSGVIPPPAGQAPQSQASNQNPSPEEYLTHQCPSCNGMFKAVKNRGQVSCPMCGIKLIV